MCANSHWSYFAFGGTANAKCMHLCSLCPDIFQCNYTKAGEEIVKTRIIIDSLLGPYVVIVIGQA